MTLPFVVRDRMILSCVHFEKYLSSFRLNSAFSFQSIHLNRPCIFETIPYIINHDQYHKIPDTSDSELV